MIRKMLSVGVAGVCLLSLLASVGAVWLWWRTIGLAGDGGWVDVEAVAGSLRVVARGTAHQRLGLCVVRQWPGPTGVRVWPVQKDALQPEFDVIGTGDDSPWRCGPWAGSAGKVRAILGPDGRPRRVDFFELTTACDRWTWPPTPWPATSPPLPYWQIDNVPPWQLAGVTALPPLLWVGVYSRRAWVRRQRRQLGLCLRCGYDLRGNPSVRCSECGADARATPALAKGTAA